MTNLSTRSSLARSRLGGEEGGSAAEVVDQSSLHGLAVGPGGTEDGRRMVCGDDRRPREIEDLSTGRTNAKARSEKGLTGGRAQRDDNRRVDDGQFRGEPLMAGDDFGLVWSLVNAPLPPRLPLEVLHGVGHVDGRPFDLCFSEGFIENAAGRTDKWLAGLILLVTRLLADEDEIGRGRPRPEHGLGCVAPQIAGPASSGARRQVRQLSGLARFHRLTPPVGDLAMAADIRTTVTQRIN